VNSLAVEIFGNIPTTTVTSGGTTAPASGTQETWTVASSTGFPAASSSATPPTQFHVADVALNSEMISVINVSGTTWTVIRGDEGTTPVAHGAGFTIYQVVSAGAYTQLRSVDWLNVVTMFGADPVGTADSTTAWTNAIAGARASGAVVYGPAGTYKTTSTIDYTGVTIIGDSSWPVPGQDLGTVFVPTSAVTGSVLQNSCPNTGGASAIGGQLYGIGIDGSNLTGSVAGIYAVGNVLHGVISGCFIYKTSGNAIDISSANSNTSGIPYGWHVDRVKIDTAGGYGVSCGGQTDSQWYDVHVINSALHGWYISGAPSNSRFTGCRAEWSNTGYYGYYLTGAWNTGTGAGGATFTGCSTDRNGQDGVHIDATGTAPVIFDGLMLRRDGRNGGSGGGSYAGLNLNGATIPVIIGSVSCFPGVDDTGAGTNSPQYGLSVTSSSYLEIASGYIQGASNAVHQGAGNSVVNIGPNVFTGSGTTTSPTVNTTPYFATMNGASLFLQKTASNVATLSVTNLQTVPTNATSQFYGAAAGDKMIAGAVTGDSSARLAIDTNGKIAWGPGNAGQDTDLYRSAAGILKTDDAFVASPLAGGTFLCPPAVVSPTAQTTYAVTSSTFAAWSSGTICTNSFTAPPSGNVMVQASFQVLGTGIANAGFALASTGTVTPIAGAVATTQIQVASVLQTTDIRFYLSGLTAGTAYQYDMLGAVASGTATIYAFGATATTLGSKGAPVVVTVQAV